MERLKIALLAGGDSPEREIALQSAAQIEAALDHTKYDITVIDLHHRDWHYTAPDGRQWQLDKNDFSLTVDGKRKVFDYALIIIHGTPGEDGRLQGYLDMMGIPYSSCSMTSSVITFDKITTKRTLAGRGIPLARERFLRRGEAFDPARIVAELGLPLFVKPNANGSSFGVTKVLTAEELPAAVDAAFAQVYGDDAVRRDADEQHTYRHAQKIGVADLVFDIHAAENAVQAEGNRQADQVIDEPVGDLRRREPPCGVFEREPVEAQNAQRLQGPCRVCDHARMRDGGNKAQQQHICPRPGEEADDRYIRR